MLHHERRIYPHSQRRTQTYPVGWTLGLVVVCMFLAYCISQWSMTEESAAPKSQSVKVPKARTTPSDAPESDHLDVPAGPVVHWFDPCEDRPNDANWTFVENKTSCEFARDLLQHDDGALGVYETMLQFGPRTTAPIATMGGHCRRFFVPLLPAVSYLENFGYGGVMSRQLKSTALRCLGDIRRKLEQRVEPDRDDAAIMLVEADLKIIVSPY